MRERERHTHQAHTSHGVSTTFLAGIGLIYDRLGPESPGAGRVFWPSYIKIRKLLAAETGHKSSSVIPRNEWPWRNSGARLPSPATRRVRSATTTTTTNLHHSVGPMDRKMPPESSQLPEHPPGVRESRVKAPRRRRRSPTKERKTRESRQTGTDQEATTARRGPTRSGWPI